MKWRWIIYIVFLVFVVALGFYRNSKLKSVSMPPAVWIASVDLPANTRVETNHLQQPAFSLPICSWSMPDRQALIGKYTIQFIGKGEPVTAEMIGTSPCIVNRTETTLIYLPAREFSNMPIQMNAGADILVCGTEVSNRYGPFTVEAVLGKAESTTLVVRVSNSVSAEVQSLTKKELRLAGFPCARRSMQPMSEYIWRPLARVKVNPNGAAWTPAIECTIPNRIYRLRTAGKWKVDSKECTADGDPALPKPSQSLICPTASRGALVAKIGGGTADNSGTILGIGRYCIIQTTPSATQNLVGPLYLGANDVPEAMLKVDGEIEVEVEIAL